MRSDKLVKKNRSTAGFTLIELMIVIAIIGILAAVAIPNFMRARERAKFIQCVESLAGLKVAMEMYITDNDEYTDDYDRLAMYMIPGCTDPEGNDCAGEVMERIEKDAGDLNDGACQDGTSITLVDNNYSYQIKGQSTEREQCKICITPKATTPEKYNAADCAAFDCQ